MICGNPSKEFNLASEYKYLLSKIRPLIEQLDKSKDAQMCLLWLSRLDQCSRDEEYERNEVLSELSRQVKNKRLEPPFSSQPPEGSLKGMWMRNSIHLRRSNDFSDGISSGVSTEMSPRSSSSSSSYSNTEKCKSPEQSPSRKCPNKGNCLKSVREPKEDHTKCFSLQEKYRERLMNDRLIIGRYQEIIKSLIMRNLKTNESLKKRALRAACENKIVELTSLLNVIDEEKNLDVKNKSSIDVVPNEILQEVEAKNSELNGRVGHLEIENNMLELKCQELEREKDDLMCKCRESDMKLQEMETHLRAVEKKFDDNFRAYEAEHRAEINELEKKYMCELSTLERILKEKHVEVNNLREQISSQSLEYEAEVHRLKHSLLQNPELEREKRKVKFLKTKIKTLGKGLESMAMAFLAHLEQMAAKKDLLISTLEMKLNSRDAENITKDFQDSFINEKVCILETQYRKLLEESEYQAAQRRKFDLQKIQVLEKQLVDHGLGVSDLTPIAYSENLMLTDASDPNGTK